MKTRDIQRRTAAYVQLPHRIAEDPKYAGIYGDDHRLAEYVRLLWAADRSFPAHPKLPRGADQPTVDAMAAVGLIVLGSNDTYVIPEVDALRSRLAEAAHQAGIASGESRRDPTEGERAVPDPGNAPFPFSATEGGTEREPTKTKTKTKTKTETNVGSSVRIGQENTQSSVSARDDGSIGSDDGESADRPLSEGLSPVERPEPATWIGEGDPAFDAGLALVSGRRLR